MYVSDKTIEELANKGINVRWYQEETYEEHKQVRWQKKYEWAYNYNKDGEFFDKKINAFRKSTPEELADSAKKFADMYYLHDDQYNADKLYIDYEGHTFVRTIASKSKEVEVDEVLKWVERDRKLYSGAYGEFATKMQQVMRALKMRSGFIYPTTYGIGLWVFYNFKAQDEKARIDELLQSWGIEYYNEYSDAQWVFRYKISKKSINLSRIK